ncbi:MAG TPA: rhodanese-like domain-containing protein, partial [Acidobacteriaceae bacterium]|nr:rhodanese-like domain-containing protein [Acidobacteriaceae bacterium]
HPTVTKLIDYEQFCGIMPEPKTPTAVVNGIPQMPVKELKRRRDAGEEVFVLDVREPFEYQIAQIGGKLIPLGELPQRVGELNPQQEIVVQCKSGGRSQRAAEFLRKNGFANVHNLAGGITAWSNEVDPTVRKY